MTARTWMGVLVSTEQAVAGEVLANKEEQAAREVCRVLIPQAVLEMPPVMKGQEATGLRVSLGVVTVAAVVRTTTMMITTTVVLEALLAAAVVGAAQLKELVLKMVGLAEQEPEAR